MSQGKAHIVTQSERVGGGDGEDEQGIGGREIKSKRSSRHTQASRFQNRETKYALAKFGVPRCHMSWRAEKLILTVTFDNGF